MSLSQVDKGGNVYSLPSMCLVSPEVQCRPKIAVQLQVTRPFVADTELMFLSDTFVCPQGYVKGYSAVADCPAWNPSRTSPTSPLIVIVTQACEQRQTSPHFLGMLLVYLDAQNGTKLLPTLWNSG